jgi:hypothetical protein
MSANRARWTWLLLILVLVAMPPGRTAVTAQSATPCDRVCLEAALDGYVDALVARQPSRLPLATSTTFTENGQRLELGDGLSSVPRWSGATDERD